MDTLSPSQLNRNAMPVLLAKHLANRSRGLAIGTLMEEADVGPVNRTTVYRWLMRAKELGLVEMIGDSPRQSVWTASHELRLQVLREQLAEPVERRPAVTYDELFLESYEPNRTFYLSEKQRKRLNEQCKPGSAAFATLTAHDQRLFLCGISYASSALEGNTYDYLATQKLLMEGLEKDGADPTEKTMILNHHEAVQYLVENIHYPGLRNDVTISPNDIRNLHALLSQWLLKDQNMCGALRRGPVTIGGSTYVPLSVPDAIEHAFQVMMEKARAIKDPYEQAMFLLVHIPYLQPFVDCNKRTARVACNIPLLKRGVIPMNWMDVKQKDWVEGVLGVYERNNTSLLSELFFDGYIRSTEQFNMMQRSCAPNEILVRYRQEIRTLIRSVVHEGNMDIPDDVAEEDREEFRVLVEEELMLLRRGSEASLIRYRLEEGDVAAWLRRDTADFRPAPAHRERMRA